MLYATLLTLLGGLFKYLQGNGYGGLGRWGFITVCLLAGFDYYQDFVFEFNLGGVFILLGCLIIGINTTFGYTDWDDILYSFMRYVTPLVLAFVFIQIGQGFTGTVKGQNLIFYSYFIGFLLAVNYKILGQEKPMWLQSLVGDKDIASPMAGLITLGGMYLTSINYG